MSDILFVGRSGSEDPDRAVLPFVAVSDAIDEGQQAAIVLMDEAVFLVKDEVADGFQATDVPPLRDLLAKAVGHGVPIYLCARCSRARGVTDADYEAKNGRAAGPDVLTELTATAGRVFSY